MTTGSDSLAHESPAQKPMTDSNSAPPEDDRRNESQAKTIVWDSKELFRQQTEILIRHGEESYRLRITRQDKLILYK